MQLATAAIHHAYVMVRFLGGSSGVRFTAISRGSTTTYTDAKISARKYRCYTVVVMSGVPPSNDVHLVRAVPCAF